MFLEWPLCYRFIKYKKETGLSIAGVGDYINDQIPNIMLGPRQAFFIGRNLIVTYNLNNITLQMMNVKCGFLVNKFS